VETAATSFSLLIATVDDDKVMGKRAVCSILVGMVVKVSQVREKFATVLPVVQIYGSVSFALIIGFGLLWFSGRWIPPARNESPALS